MVDCNMGEYSYQVIESEGPQTPAQVSEARAWQARPGGQRATHRVTPDKSDKTHLRAGCHRTAWNRRRFIVMRVLNIPYKRRKNLNKIGIFVVFVKKISASHRA